MAAKTDLVIVESPSKAKTIGKYLGPGYEVKASMGHVRDLPKSKIGVDIEGGFVPQYQPIKGKEDVISDLKKAAKKSGRVYLATDPDLQREHQEGGQRLYCRPPGHRPEPGGRPAGTAHPGPHRGL